MEFSVDIEGFEKNMQEQKTFSIPSEVSTEDWSVLIPGNVETFVGYDKVENRVNHTYS
jgi:alanyl-tRNA synthetase